MGNVYNAGDLANSRKFPEKIEHAPIEDRPLHKDIYLMSENAVQNYIDENNFDEGQIEDIWTEFYDQGEVKI